MTTSLLIAASIYCFAIGIFQLMFLAPVQLARLTVRIGRLKYQCDANAEHNAHVQRRNVRFSFALHPQRVMWTLPAAMRTVVQPFQFSMRNRPSQAITAIFALSAIIYAETAWALR